MADDLFNARVLEERLAKILAKEKPINLRDLDVEPYEFRPGYTVLEFNFDSDYRHFRKEIKDATQEVCDDLGSLEFNLFTPLFEAILNAHQHGNKNDPNKGVTVAYKRTDATVEVSVIDQGGEINPGFFPFVSLNRRNAKQNTGKSLNFYEVCGLEANGPNLGTGTNFLHVYMDRVSYYRSKEGGLVVHLVKNL